MKRKIVQIAPIGPSNSENLLALIRDPAAIEIELTELRSGIESHRAEAVRLGGEWLHAPAQAAAEKIEATRRECLRLADRDAGRIPEIDARLTAAKARAQREVLDRHRSIAAALYPRLRAAIESAAAVQQEAIKAREAAVAELGEGLVTAHIPRLAYGGFLMHDLVARWKAQQDRLWAVSWPPPEPPQRSDAPPGEYRAPRLGPQIGGTAPAVPPATRKPPAAKPLVPALRVPRQDGPPAEGESRVIMLRGGMHHPADGKQLAAGDVVNLPSGQARTLIDRGIVDFARPK